MQLITFLAALRKSLGGTKVKKKHIGIALLALAAARLYMENTPNSALGAAGTNLDMPIPIVSSVLSNTTTTYAIAAAGAFFLLK